jgi:hypothetical protein
MSNNSDPGNMSNKVVLPQSVMWTAAALVVAISQESSSRFSC